jgi:hypothetical protein
MRQRARGRREINEAISYVWAARGESAAARPWGRDQRAASCAEVEARLRPRRPGAGGHVARLARAGLVRPAFGGSCVAEVAQRSAPEARRRRLDGLLRGHAAAAALRRAAAARQLPRRRQALPAPAGGATQHRRRLSRRRQRAARCCNGPWVGQGQLALVGPDGRQARWSARGARRCQRPCDKSQDGDTDGGRLAGALTSALRRAAWMCVAAAAARRRSCPRRGRATPLRRRAARKGPRRQCSA